ncbi:MAG: bifunctional aldolase/short-chain dehydrogenase [Candidatus Omnitrophica bacterium]|nr:bifunctional aldolase/short-chain dehydrogenase [Candidatus Omnitrophota bacterium]
MKNLFENKEAEIFADDPLQMRVYTSRLLGREADLVLHGGGNTSVKAQVKNLFGEWEDVLYIKGSGWDLATIDKKGFAAVKMDVLLKMAQLETLNDTAMVKTQRAAMLDPNAPTPSVEAILHAIIPFKYVDHTHADAIVTITNTSDGAKRIAQVFGKRVLYVPYVMPGFILARKVYEMTQGIDWKEIDAIILLNHGIFTFHDEAKESYSQMIRLVSDAERYLAKHAPYKVKGAAAQKVDLKQLSLLRKEVSSAKGGAMLAQLKEEKTHVQFSSHKNVRNIATRGPLTPDHIIRTKQSALVLGTDPQKDVRDYAQCYQQYFKKHALSHHHPIDAAPRWAVWPDRGVISFGATLKDAKITSDIVDHTIKAISQAETMGGWAALPAKDLFEMEYWELEQAKLKKNTAPPEFQGKIVLVTGAASGIGRACVEKFCSLGAVVAALDISAEVLNIYKDEPVLPMVCDLTKSAQVTKAVEKIVRHFGGLDVLVSNAGTFPQSQRIEQMSEDIWEKSLAINLSSHQRLLQACIPFLANGLDPAVIIVGSKNVPAPGPGASAYSVAKAGLTQLARLAALELAASGIRVNVVHPNQVFDTAIWTRDVLEKRAKAYGLSVEEYKTNNLLKTTIESRDVAALVAVMAGGAFSKTTGAQVPIDGGNERVI